MPRSSARRPTLALLVRHGQTPTTGKVLPGRAPGLHLSEEGVAQAKAAAELISSSGAVAGVYASPLERTRETAAPIAERLGLAVEVEERLSECDFGEWTGANLAELRKLREWRTVQSWPGGWRFPGGESFLEMQARMVSCMTELVHRHPGETFVAVSHADPIKALVAHAVGQHVDLFQRITVSPASISAISFGEDGPSILALNSGAAPWATSGRKSGSQDRRRKGGSR